MKRILVFIFALLIMGTLCACENTENVEKLNELIISIGPVTLEDKETIVQAREQYEALSDSQKEKVENYSILEAAEKEIAAIELEEQKKAEIEKNYVRILDWIVQNGNAILDESDVNNYGNVREYSYIIQSSGDIIGISFLVDSDGSYGPHTQLELARLVEPSAGWEYTECSHLYFNTQELNFLWRYDVYMVTEDLFSGWINENDIASFSRTNSDYSIVNYKEAYDFKKISGHTDVRSVIIDDLFETADVLENFIYSKLGLSMADIGFLSYSE